MTDSYLIAAAVAAACAAAGGLLALREHLRVARIGKMCPPAEPTHGWPALYFAHLELVRVLVGEVQRMLEAGDAAGAEELLCSSELNDFLEAANSPDDEARVLGLLRDIRRGRDPVVAVLSTREAA